MSDLYEYNDINEKTKQYVIDNFNEDPSHVNEHIESLRKWVVSMPHLKCPTGYTIIILIILWINRTDNKFLIRFLRKAKFDIEKAKQLVDNCCTIRCSRRGSQPFFNRKIVDDGLTEKFLDAQFWYNL